MQNQVCFLLSYIKYGDNDAVLHCFSKDAGYQSFFARGIYSARNKKKAYLFPLNQINITVVPRRNSGGIPTISKIEMVAQDYDFADVKINTVLLFVADFLNQVLREETHHSNTYSEIGRFLNALYSGDLGAYTAFIFKILSCQGLSPLPGDGDYLDPESGTFSASQTHSFFTEEISAVWKQLASAADIYDVALKRPLRRSFLDSLMLYYKFHVTGFSEPNSLEIIHQIYE